MDLFNAKALSKSFSISKFVFADYVVQFYLLEKLSVPAVTVLVQSETGILSSVDFLSIIIRAVDPTGKN